MNGAALWGLLLFAGIVVPYVIMIVTLARMK